MKINIYGMGYVGTVSAACLAANGNDVTGIDVDGAKVEMIEKGKSPIIESGLEQMLKEVVASGNLKATTNNPPHSDVSIVCVGTPSNENGSLNYEHVVRVAGQIGVCMKEYDGYHVVNIRSTVLPGTTEEIVLPEIEKYSEKRAGIDFGICMNPEFMREGSSIEDYYNPPFTVIGQLDEKSGDVVAALYEKAVSAPIVRTEIKTAEMLKYACNAFHAIKVSFANEIGNLCKKMKVDSHMVMDLLCRDRKLNLSPYYLKPGFAFGGSCLPKDLRAILYKAKEMDLEAPVLNAALESNKKQIDVAFNMVHRNGTKKVGVLGLSFKSGTDDLRESPMVDLVERLLGKGYAISIYDKDVSTASLFGSNRKYIESVIPHISSLMKNSIREVVEDSEVLIVAGAGEEHREALSYIRDTDTFVVDLVRIAASAQDVNCFYEGICW